MQSPLDGAGQAAVGSLQRLPPELNGPEYVPPPAQQRESLTLSEIAAAEADQGVAVDADYLYAVDNSAIGKYSRSSGERVGGWSGPRDGLIRHLNSCFAERGKLWCANSNFSQTPMASSVERFDARTMTHDGTHSLGLTDEGSLTWFDRFRGGWIAGFAHYDGNGGSGFKDHRYSSVVTFDSRWRRTGGWLFPATVVERMSPDAASGGAIGPDGLLYVMGRNRPEMYVLAAPSKGPVMIHVATIAVEAEGQAFSWERGASARTERIVHVIDRRRFLLRRLKIPPVDLAAYPDARRLD
ncbi:hypothetical protein GC169_02380 [bacterium]|nr:hypothetical protein [bacterium]